MAIPTINPEDFEISKSAIKWQSDTYYKRDTSGNIRMWRVWVCTSPGINEGDEESFEGLGSLFGSPKYYLQSASGIAGGNVRVAKETEITEAKSQGTILAQAIAEGESKLNEKRKEGYIGNYEKSKSNLTIRPMLAHEWGKHGHKMQFPAVIQRKYDGVRVLIHRLENGDVEILSRKGLEYTGFNKIVSDVKRMKLPPNFILDGELYQHGKSLQAISGLARKKATDPETLKKKDEMYVRVYDAIDLNNKEEGFFKRYNKAMQLIKNSQSLKPCESFIIPEADGVQDYREQFVKEGYEGAMVRGLLSPYKINGRSYDLLKVKTFQDDEFKIIGWEREGTGNHEGCVTWICEAPNGSPFTVVPLGSLDSRREALKTADDQVGKMLTVKFFEYSPDGIPLYAKGVAIRDYE